MTVSNVILPRLRENVHYEVILDAIFVLRYADNGFVLGLTD